jgi:hypothetical protein
MHRPMRLRARRALLPIGFAALLALTGVIPVATVSAANATDVLLNWNAYAIAALSNPTAPPVGVPPGAGYTPPVASSHLAMVQIAVYDAVNAIDRGHEPYLRGLPRVSSTANKAAAAATAAHHVLVGLVPALPADVISRLNTLYADTLAGISNGSRKNAGIRIGAAAAAKMLSVRANDGRFVPFQFTAGTGVGQWRPELPAFVSDPFAWVSNVKPFAMRRPSQFRTSGPPAITSARYTAEYNEVKSLGASDSTTRTPAQTEVAHFFTANPLVFMNAAFRDIAVRKGLSITRAARLFGMLSMSSADALIGCWDSKDYWSFWRPITAIRAGDSDGNPATAGRGDWLPLLATPPYPDEPSGYNCFTASMMYAGKAFFGTDRVGITLTSPTGTAPRTYSRLTSVIRDTINARVWLGIHFRTADVHGASLGRNVAGYVANHYFERED